MSPILDHAIKIFRSSEQDRSTFVFGIPLIGSHLTDNFDRVCKLLGKTLESCLQQTDSNFMIYVACNEIPDARFVPSSSKIRYFLTKTLGRSEVDAKPRADVSLKRQSLMKVAVDNHARYYFQFDADDLVSENLVRSVRHASNLNGHIFLTGYLLDSRTGLLYLFPNPQYPNLSFYELCGSSSVISLEHSPDEKIKQQNMNYMERILWPGHHVAKTTFERVGRPAQALDFPACIYRANHGSNLYMRLNHSERTNFMDAVAAKCMPLEGVALEKVRKEFRFQA